jgi:hypothetical protein
LQADPHFALLLSLLESREYEQLVVYRLPKITEAIAVGQAHLAVG